MKELEGIIKYLDNEVIGEEKQLFEKELLVNPKLQQQLELLKEVDSTLDDDAFLNYHEKLKSAFQEFRLTDDETPSEKKPTKTFKLKIRWQYLSVAALGLIVISTFFFRNISEPANDKLFKQYYSKYEANIVTRSESNDNNDLINAIQLYDRGNYSEAIQNFKNILKTDASNTAAHFFLGVSYMETNNFANAIENLTYVIKQNDTVFVEHAEWYIAMCYVKTNQTKLAIPLLTKISNTKNFYKLMASDLLKKIK
jgi:tetratricopeptide (TPR) repeat protein